MQIAVKVHEGIYLLAFPYVPRYPPLAAAALTSAEVAAVAAPL
jgi:hypothetical protein